MNLQTTPENKTPVQDIKRYKTVVCVTDQFSCERIIRSGSALASVTDTDLAVINVSTPQRPNDPAAMEILYRVAADYNGEMSVLYSAEIAKAIIRYVKDNRVAYVVTGIPSVNDSVTTKLWKKFTHVKFFVVEENGELTEMTRLAMQEYEQMRT